MPCGKKIDILLCVLKKIDSPYVLVVFVMVTTSKVDVTRSFNWFYCDKFRTLLCRRSLHRCCRVVLVVNL